MAINPTQMPGAASTPAPSADALTDQLDLGMKQYPVLSKALKTEQQAGEKAVEAKVQAESLAAKEQAKAKREQLEKYQERVKTDVSELEKQEQPMPEFKPSQENALELGAIFSMIATVGVGLGGSGKLSGLNALNAMGGMLKGYQSGKKDVFEKEQKIYEKEVARIKAANDNLEKKINRYLQLSATDKEAAYLLGQEIVAENPGVVAANINAGKADVVQKITAKYTEILKSILEKSMKTGIAGKGGAGGLNGRYAFNILEAAQQAGADLLNIARMPSGTVLGTFAGMTGQGGDTLLSSLSNTFARNITDEDSRQFQQLISGFDMNMARALGGGYANSGAKAAVQAYKEQVARSGDSPLAQATFLARAKQELSILNNAYKAHPGANDAEKQQMQQLTDSIAQVVPFTVQDVVTASGGKGVPTIAQTAQSLSLIHISEPTRPY